MRLVKDALSPPACAGDLTEGERRLAFGGHSLRAGLASSAQIEEAHVQKTSRPRQRRNDPPLPAQTRPVHDQPHQGGRPLGQKSPFVFSCKGFETIDKYKLSMVMGANLRISAFRRPEARKSRAHGA